MNLFAGPDFRKTLAIASGLGSFWSTSAAASIVAGAGLGSGPVLRCTASGASAVVTRAIAPVEYYNVQTGDILEVAIRARQSVGGDATGTDWRADFVQRDAVGTSKGWITIINGTDLPADGLWYSFIKRIVITTADVVEAAFYLRNDVGFTTGYIDVDYYGVKVVPQVSDNDSITGTQVDTAVGWTTTPEDGATYGDPYGMTENLLGVDAGPIHNAVYYYYDKEAIVNLGLTIGDTISFSGLVSCTDAAATNVRIYAVFYTAADAVISTHNGTLYSGVFTDSLTKLDNVIIPATASKIRIALVRTVGDTAQITARRVMLNRGPVALPYVRAVADGADVTGSNTALDTTNLNGHLTNLIFDGVGRFKDLYRIPMTNQMGTTASRTVNPLSAADVGATATISIASHTVYNGDATGTTYNAGSITGLSFSTQYLVYADDPTYAGGAVTYVATTSGVVMAQNLGRYYVGSITTPADGAPPADGGGGIFECIDVEMWLREGLQARDLVAGDNLDILEEIDGIANGENYSPAPMHSVDFSEQSCVEIITSGGAKLITSISTPVTSREGILMPVTECLGFYLPTVIDGTFEWQEVISLEPVGIRPVAHVHIGGRTFAAGSEARARIFTHNLKL